jgi:hypothetical protein
MPEPTAHDRVSEFVRRWRVQQMTEGATDAVRESESIVYALGNTDGIAELTLDDLEALLAPVLLDFAPNRIDTDHKGNLTLGWWIMVGSKGGTRDVAHCNIPAHSIPTFLSDVTRDAMYVLRDVGKAIAYGDCGTCGNRRLVDIEVHGRPSNKNCPDCREGKRVPEAFEEYPRLRHPDPVE